MDERRRHYVCWRYEGALRRQCEQILERALAIEARYSADDEIGPSDRELLGTLLARAGAIMDLLDDAEAHRHFVPALLPAWSMPDEVPA